MSGLHKIERHNGSWFPVSVIDAVADLQDGPDFGWSLFQLIVQNIDSRAGARAGDVAATLAFLAGKIVQRATLRDHPEGFQLHISANGVAYLRSELVSHKLAALSPGTLASALIEAAVIAGAGSFPQFAMVVHEASDAIQRRGSVELRGIELSDGPRELLSLVQEDIDSLLVDPFNRAVLVRAAIQACGHAIGYQRARLCPTAAAELSLSVALYGGWLDQRETARR